MIKVIVYIVVLILAMVTGLLLAPSPELKYDPLTLKGYDYADSYGTFILKGEKINVRQVYSPDGLMFLQEPDGTNHLYTMKGSAYTLKMIKANQSEKFYNFRIKYYKFFISLMHFRNGLVEDVQNLIKKDKSEEIKPA